MATEEGIRRLFAFLESAGIPQPEAWRKPDHKERAEQVKTSVKVWAFILGDVQDDDLLQAGLAFVRSGDVRFWPLPGELLDIVQKRKQPAYIAEDADNEFGYVMDMARLRGRYNPPVTGAADPGHGQWSLAVDPIRRAALELGVRAAGGWDALCNNPLEQHPSMRAAFRSAYRNAIERNQTALEKVNISKLLETREKQRQLTKKEEQQ